MPADLGKEFLAAITGVVIPMWFMVRRRRRERAEALVNPTTPSVRNVIDYSSEAHSSGVRAKFKGPVDRTDIIAASIIALGLIIGAFLFGGIYESRTGVRGAVVFRVNRFTGATAACFLGQDCRAIPDAMPTVDFLAGASMSPEPRPPAARPQLRDDLGILSTPNPVPPP